MSVSYYECHITMQGHPAILKPLVEACKWKFSAIDGDPVLGDGIKCYATNFYNAKLHGDVVARELLSVARRLEAEGARVIRRKVERVIFDDRSEKVQPCAGACAGCHIDDYAVASA